MGPSTLFGGRRGTRMPRRAAGAPAALAPTGECHHPTRRLPSTVMPTTTPSRSASDLPGKVVVEAGRAMLPVLAGKLLAAVADRAVDAVDSLAGRLDDLGAEQRAPRRQAEPDATPARSGGGGGTGAAFSLVVTQARALLDLLMRLLQQAAQALRGLAARARRQQAPAGHDAEREALEDADEDAPEPARAS